MRAVRFLVLAGIAATVAGCMQSGGAGIFARNAPPLYQSNAGLSIPALPAMLRPGYRRAAAARPAGRGEPLAPQPISPAAYGVPAPHMIAQPVVLEAAEGA